MIIRAVAIMAAAFLLTGCGKKPATSSTIITQTAVQPAPVQNNTVAPEQNNVAAPEQNSQTSAPSAGYTGGARLTPVVAPGTDTGVAPDLNAMSLAVRIWIRTRQQVPKDFEEWAAAPNYAYPPPPPGKKYAFDRKYHVILVNR